MSELITDIDDARDLLGFEIQYDLPPTLTNTASTGDLDRILAKCKQASLWVAATAFSVGDIVIPITRNGHRFRCVTAGTSGATEPSWTSANYSSTSDNTILWEEDGIEYDLWNMGRAINEGWKLKKSKAVVYIGSEDGLEQIYQHCAEMELQTRTVMVA